MPNKNLKIAINRWAFDSAMPMYDCVDLAKQSGYDGIELNLEEDGDFSLQTTAKELERVRQHCVNRELEISSLCSLLFWKYPCTSSAEKVSSKGIEVVRTMIEFASSLQIEKILIVPGLVHADPPLDFGNQPEPYERVYHKAVNCMSKLAWKMSFIISSC
jgi:L-ribulose-5-phosphate 3-epimerase